MKFILIILIILIIILFFIFNKLLNLNEYYEKEESGLVCGTQNDVCYQSSCGTDSCCDNFKCILPNGDYQYKICVRNSNIFSNLPYISGISVKKPKISLPSLPSLPSLSSFSICPAANKLKKYIKEEEEESS